MEALVTIREYKSHLLEGSSFIALPHHTHPNEVVPDHTEIVTTEPKSAIKLLNKYCKLVGAMFNTHKVIVEDRNVMLKKATETTRVEQVPRSRYSPTPEPIHYPLIPPTEENTEDSHADSIEPSVPE